MAYEDLLKDTSESKDDGNYFLVTITDLDLGTAYPLQFRWKNKNGTLGAWSSVKTFVSESATIPSEPNLGSGDVVGGAGFITVTWNGNNALSAAASNFDRVNIHISGATFGDGTKPAGFFKQAGTQTFTTAAGVYIVQLKTIAVDGTESLFSTARTVTVTEVTEEIQTPVAPTGFTSERILGGIEVAWAGTYGSAWTGFEAINIYAGTSSTATGGTYIKVGQMTANKISNKIVVPVDGTYVRYGVPVYIHASSVNKNSAESAISANVTSQSSGARSAIGTDLADEIITSAKLVADSVTATKIATAAITETKIASDAVTSPKIIAGAITSAKIDALAITAEKIAANAITASKILAGEIDVTKLSAGTISVNNLESGTLSATSFIRAGTAGSSRIEISSAAVSASSILAGLYIYNSSGTPVLSAPLGGGITIVGDGTFTGDISGATGTLTNALNVGTISGGLYPFSVSSSGVMRAISGTIGGLTLAADAIQNTGNTFRLDSSGIIRAGSSSSNAIIISPTLGIYHSANGGSTASGRFTLGLASSTISGWTIGTSTLSSGNLTLNSNGTITTTNLTIYDTGRILNSGGFEVTAAGQLIATGANISGAITATSGSFAGSLSAATGTFAGSLSAATGTFAGSLSAASGTFTGSLTTNGTAGGYANNTLTIAGGKLSADKVIYLQTDISTGVIDVLGSIIYLEAPTEITGSVRASASATFGVTGSLFEFLSSSGNVRVAQTYNNSVSGRAMQISSAGMYGTTASTRRKKHEIESYRINSEALLNLDVKAFKYKPEIDQGQQQQHGFIAEDAEELGLNELIQYDSNGIPDYFAYEKLPIFLLQLIQEQDASINAMQARLDALEG
jgi:hypothetical protein